jgi:hypothetical protein
MPIQLKLISSSTLKERNDLCKSLMQHKRLCLKKSSQEKIKSLWGQEGHCQRPMDHLRLPSRGNRLENKNVILPRLQRVQQRVNNHSATGSWYRSDAEKESWARTRTFDWILLIINRNGKQSSLKYLWAPLTAKDSLGHGQLRALHFWEGRKP